MDELELKAPTLHSILKMCVDVKRRRVLSKRSYRSSNVAVMGVFASAILRHKNQCMNVLQRIISLALHCGHSGKQVSNILKYTYVALIYLSILHVQVYRRLQKLLLCLSHRHTNALLDEMGKDFSSDVYDWKAKILSAIVRYWLIIVCG